MRWLTGLVVLLGGCAALTPPDPVELAPRSSVSESITVIVYDVEDRGSALEANDRAQLSEFFRGQVALQPRFQLVPGDRVRQEIQTRKREGYQPGRDEATQIEIGRAASASHMIRPQLLKLGNRCTLTVALYDLKTESRTQTQAVETGCDIASQRDASTKVARLLGLPTGEVDINGVWAIVAEGGLFGPDRYEVSFVQRGPNVVGNISSNGRYEGTIKAGVLEGTWQRNGFSGRLRLVFSQDGRTCAGTWGLGKTDPSNVLKGKRTATVGS